MTDLIAPVTVIIASVGAVFSCAKTIWYAFGMLRGLRSSAEPWTQLLPFVAPLLPGALDASGKVQRARFVVWGLITLAFALLAVIVRHLADS